MSKNRFKRKIQLLDCTLRDGGNALEDVYFNDGKTVSLEKNSVSVMQALTDSGIDIIEIGVLDKNAKEKEPFSYYTSMDKASAIIPKGKNQNQLVVIGSNINPEWIDEVPDYKEGLCDGIRIYLLYSKLKESLEYSAMWAKKGYKVFLQNALTMRYTEDDLKLVVEYANKMNAYAVYTVDTNGYMQEDDTDRLIDFFDKELESYIHVGFHAHDNCKQAFYLTKSVLEKDLKHDLIVDACLLGMGRGAGNLQTELIAPYLNRSYEKEYDIGSVFDGCEIIDEYLPKGIWGYSALNLIAALNGTTNKYANVLYKEYGYSYKIINDILSAMPQEYKYRYTKNNVENMIRLYNNKKGINK